MRTLPVRYPQLAEELRRQGVANLEMESSALFVLTSLAGLRAERSVRRTHSGSKERSWKGGKGGCGGTLHRCRLTGIHLLWVKDQEQDGDPRRRST